MPWCAGLASLPARSLTLAPSGMAMLPCGGRHSVGVLVAPLHAVREGGPAGVVGVGSRVGRRPGRRAHGQADGGLARYGDVLAERDQDLEVVARVAHAGGAGHGQGRNRGPHAVDGLGGAGGTAA